MASEIVVDGESFTLEPYVCGYHVYHTTYGHQLYILCNLTLYSIIILYLVLQVMNARRPGNEARGSSVSTSFMATDLILLN